MRFFTTNCKQISFVAGSYKTPHRALLDTSADNLKNNFNFDDYKTSDIYSKIEINFSEYDRFLVLSTNNRFNVNKKSSILLRLTDDNKNQYANLNLTNKNNKNIKFDFNETNKNNDLFNIRWKFLKIFGLYILDTNRNFILNLSNKTEYIELKDNHLNILLNSSNLDLKQIGQIKKMHIDLLKPYILKLHNIDSSSNIKLKDLCENKFNLNFSETNLDEQTMSNFVNDFTQKHGDIL